MSGISCAAYGAMALMAVGLTACGNSEQTGPSDIERQIFAQSEVEKLLRDPNSAEFSDAYVSRKAGVPTVCGTVNSKNGFGGMSGPQRYVSGGVTVLEEQMEDGDMAQVWSQFC